MEDLIKDRLVGEQLSSVEFVQDYLQLHFDGITFTIYIWPNIILDDKKSYYYGDIDFRNKLCVFIGKKVKDVKIRKQEDLIFIFENEKAIIRLDLNPKNPEIVSEIAVFEDYRNETDSIFQVFD